MNLILPVVSKVRLRLRLFGGLDLLVLFLFPVLVPPVKADRRFQDEENVVAGSFDFADRLRDPVGLGKGIVDRVSQFLHQVLQWLFHRVLPYMWMRRNEPAFHLGPGIHPFRL